MSMGTYDEEEHERRAAMTSEVDAQFEDGRTEYRGSLTYDSGESAEELLDQFKEIQDD